MIGDTFLSEVAFQKNKTTTLSGTDLIGLWKPVHTRMKTDLYVIVSMQCNFARVKG